MTKTLVIKRISAIVLCITFFLPLSQCQMNKLKMSTTLDTGEQISQAVDNSQPAVDEKPRYSYNIPARMFSPTDLFSWILLLAFVWPLLFWATLHVNTKKKVAGLLNILEPFACLGSAYVAYSLAYLGEILIGGYLALGSVAAYFFSSCYELYGTAKMRIKNDSRRSS